MADPLIDETFSDGLMSGTFRWAKAKKFVQLPPLPTNGAVEAGKGWRQYLETRAGGKDALVQVAMRDSSLLDCLSFPMTLVFWLRQLNLLPRTSEGHAGEALNIIVFGATQKAVRPQMDPWRLHGQHPARARDSGEGYAVSRAEDHQP